MTPTEKFPFLAVDDLDGDDAVGVGDGVLGRVQVLATLLPLDLG